MKPKPKPTKDIWTPVLPLRIGPLTAYFILVAIAPFTVNTTFFMPLVISIRGLLLSPLLISSLLSERAGSYLPPEKAQEHDMNVFIVMGIGSIYLICIQTMLTLSYNGFSFRGLLGAINNDPAVSTLGYDYILSLVSAGMWYRSLHYPGGDKIASTIFDKNVFA